MADPQQLAILHQGVEAWNTWRKAHPHTQADLSGADLSGADFTKANFSRANLRRANLRRANLHKANFIEADISGADLSGADLSEAHLLGTDLSRVNLTATDMTNAWVGDTHFADVDLSSVKGLKTLCHWWPSHISIVTLYRSQGQIPESFLREVGVPEDFLVYLPSLVNKAIEYYTCFISYTKEDEEFAKRLHADLQANGVRCWFAPEDLKIGEKYHDRIFQSIRLYDKLLLILSQQSVKSGWVQAEVEAALWKEYQKNREVLFPVRLDSTVLESPSDWAKTIQKTRHIGDFTQWKDHDAYQLTFQRLLRDLQATKPRPRSKRTSKQ